MKHQLVLLILFFSQISLGQGPLNQLFAGGNYENCIEESEKILKEDPRNGSAYFFKGASLVRLEKFKKAEIALKKALENGFAQNPVNANLLRAYLGQNQTAKFFELLTKVADEGFSNYTYLNNEVFKEVKNNEEFKTAHKKIFENAFPCIAQKNTQRLDFWLGEWDIYNPNTGAKVAKSSITKSKDGCTLYEDYEHQSGFFGRSVNYYDPADKLYKQVWVDLRNRVSNYKEVASQEGVLTLQANLGNNTLTRTTWTYNKEDDTVLQAAENSNDNGKTWSPGFSGLYKRKKVELNQVLQARFDEMEALFLDNKMEEIAKYYTDDAQMLEPGGSVYTGNEAIKDYWKTLNGQGISWKLDVIEANETGNLAYSVATSNLKYRNNGKEALAKTKAMIIWEKTDDGYKIKKDFFHFIR